jgi:integrase/recombinase XerD
VLVPLPPAVGRAIEPAIAERTTGPILLTSSSTRMDQHCATRRLRRRSEEAGVRLPRMHPHMLRHTFVTTTLDAESTFATSRSPPATPTRAPPCATTGPQEPRPTPSYLLSAYMASGT